MQITLSQFEQIDGLFRSCLARPALESVIGHPLASRDYIRDTYFRPEWKLTDALVEALGLDAVQGALSVVDCAAELLTGCLLCTVDVIDEEAS